MPVSYLSTPIKSNPYVPPVDLDLMGKVLQYKEQEYQTHKSQLQQTINNFAGMDVIKPEDRAYLNNKVNALVNNINGVSRGNADLGDPNTFSQLESYASNIYSDPKITNAIAGTQLVRNLQREYNDYRTNPKMKGMFGISNYSQDMSAVQKWLSDGQTGSSYNGPSSATPYKDVDKKQAEIAKEMKANEFTYDQSNGLYIERTTGKSLTEDQIQQVVSQRLMNDPDYAAQIRTNAWYLTEGQGITGKDIIDHNSQLLGNQISDIDNNIAKNKDLLQKAAGSPQDTKAYSDRIADLTQIRNKIMSQKQDLDKNGLSNFEKNPGAYQTNYYLNNLTAGIAATYAFRNESHELKPDQAAMFQARYAQQEQEMELKAAMHGFSYELDPTTGQKRWIFKGLPGGMGNGLGGGAGIERSGVAAPNRVTDLDSLEKNADKTSQEIGSLEAQKKGFLVGYLNDAMRSDPNLSFLKDSSGKIAGQDALTELGKTGTKEGFFNIGDLAPEYVNQALAQKKITPEQAKWFGSLYQAYNDKAEGKKIDISQFPEGFDQSYEQLSEINNEIEFKRKQLAQANDSLGKAAGLNGEQVDLLTDFQMNSQKYYHATPHTAYRHMIGDVYGTNTPSDPNDVTLDPNVQAIKNKIAALPKATREAYWDNISRRVQYPYGVDTLKDKKGIFLAAPLLKQSHDSGNIIGESVGDTFAPEDIKAIGYHKNEDPNTVDRFPYVADVTVTIPGENGKKTDKIEQIGVDPVLAQERGLTVNNRKLQNITDEVMQSQEGSQPRIVSNPNTGFSIKVVVNKATNDYNDTRSQARVMIPNHAKDITDNQGNVITPGYDYLKIGNLQDSPAAAYNFAQDFIRNYQGTDFDQFAKQAIEFNSRPSY